MAIARRDIVQTDEMDFDYELEKLMYIDAQGGIPVNGALAKKWANRDGIHGNGFNVLLELGFIKEKDGMYVVSGPGLLGKYKVKKRVKRRDLNAYIDLRYSMNAKLAGMRPGLIGKLRSKF